MRRSDFIEFKFTEEDIEWAIERGKMIGHRNNSNTNGEMNHLGCLAELGISRMLGVPLWADDETSELRYNCDMIYRGMKLEVKGKECSFKPLENYNASIYETSEFQEFDAVAFGRIHESLTHGWFVGAISKKRFRKKSELKKKGEIDPDSSPRKPYKFKADTRIIPISMLGTRRELDEWCDRHGALAQMDFK